MNTNECKQSISGLVTVVGATGLARQHKCLEGTIYIYIWPPPTVRASSGSPLGLEASGPCIWQGFGGGGGGVGGRERTAHNQK